MKYLIKDLSRITGLPSARIRKWQERYNILRPELGNNGYHYYSNEDLLVLKNITTALESGNALSAILGEGRKELQRPASSDQFTEREWKQIKFIGSGSFKELGSEILLSKKNKSIRHWIKSTLQPLVILVGRAWEAGVLSVANEHAFSRWFSTFFPRHLPALSNQVTPKWLVVVHPSDEHELGALMHFADLMDRGIPARFCGRLPEQELIGELYACSYQKVSISLAVPRKENELIRLKGRIQKRFPEISILFGGYGWRNRMTSRVRGKD